MQFENTIKHAIQHATQECNSKHNFDVGNVCVLEHVSDFCKIPGFLRSEEYWFHINVKSLRRLKLLGSPPPP